MHTQAPSHCCCHCCSLAACRLSTHLSPHPLRTVRTWDVYDGKAQLEVLQHGHDVLAIAWRPDGKQLASSTLDGQIYFWNAQVRCGLAVCAVQARVHCMLWMLWVC